MRRSVRGGDLQDDDILSRHSVLVGGSIAALLGAAAVGGWRRPGRQSPGSDRRPAVPQGEGVGSALVRHVLDDRANIGEPAYLETETEANVPFYERHGFEVIGQLDVPGGGPHLWLMWREPHELS
jgi:Acetyltransferase (GNAT) family